MKKIALLLLFHSVSVLASISPQARNALHNSALLKGGGTIRGGLAGTGFSLLDLQTNIAKSQKLERLTVAIGDANFHPHQGSPGYFHIENSPDLHRVVINFTQTMNTKFDEKSLQKKWTQSPFVKSSQLLFDPETQTMSLVLQMKKQAGVRVVAVNGTKQQTAQLKIDLFDESLLNSKRKK